ncbi:uncharacterized protein SAPINGB_P003627 [Magnusiomyces paraingens]|uniref:Uncharacterized protein n=1 Tax=Magnusiomyces paraingens TaxID=2606893 RepID=A0A5E8BQA3_9ASCO|nr:uncharacterized protein SAPINGB_P003627 [Saprochaete ingens]VVT53543.1 unnamed protein product [Saprochaete ingens]
MLTNTLQYDYNDLKILTKAYKNQEIQIFTFSMTKKDWVWNAGVRLYKSFSKFKKLKRLTTGIQVFNLCYSITMSILGVAANLPIQPDLGLSSSILSISAHVFNLHLENSMSDNIMRLCKIMKNYEAIKRIQTDDSKELTWKKIEATIPYPTELFQ